MAYLLLSANRSVSTESLVEALWGDAPPSTARNQIQVDVSAVRRTLREAGRGDCLQTTSTGYRVAVERDELDLTLFSRLVAQARSLPDRDHDAAAQLMRKALGLWRGPALGDISASYVKAARAALEEQRLSALENLADLELQLGRHHDVAAELGVLTQDHPLHEGIARRLALALYRCGRPSDALALLRALRTALAEEYGVDPAPPTSALELSILRTDPALDAAVTARATALPRNPLPPDVAAFAGRRRYLGQLDAEEAALVTITGSGGIGKTALALRWAHREAHRYRDGLLYVDLQGFSGEPPLLPVEALSRLLYQLGVPPEQIPAREDFATDLYRGQVAHKHMLIILDNARNSEQARPLLPGSPNCRILVTSRIELTGLVARDGARPIRLGTLEPAEAHQLLATLLCDGDAVDRPDGTLAELASLCAYVPLALRIAAAALVGQPQRRIDEYIARLRSTDRLGVLKLEGDDYTAMSATIDVSYIALTPGAQRLFRLLSLVPGPDFTLTTAGDLSGATVEETQPFLVALTRAHLVEERAPDRYAFHDLLRLYAANQASVTHDDADRSAARQRLLAHYLRYVDAAAQLLYPQVLRMAVPDKEQTPILDDPARAVAWMDAERANLVAAVVTFAEHGPTNMAWQLADSLRGYFFLRMFTVDWRTVAAAAFESARAHADHRAQAAALLSMADLHWRHGDYDAADEAYAQATEHAELAGWPEGQAVALGNLGGLRRMQGQLQAAVILFERSLELNIKVDRLEGQSINLGNLAIAYAEMGDYDRAQEYSLDAYDAYRKIGSRTAEAILLTNMGELALMRGASPDAAAEHLQRAIGLHRELGDKAGEASTLRAIASVHQARGDLGLAVSVAQVAADLAQESADQRVLANCLRAVAVLLRLTGDVAAALEHGQHSLDLAQTAKHQYVETRALIALAEIHRDLDHGQTAEGYVRRAIGLARSAGYAALEREAAEVIPGVATSSNPDTGVGPQ